MKAWEFNAVVHDGTVYCNNPSCLPDGITPALHDVCPIYPIVEADSYPVCDTCGRVHDYVGLTEWGQRYERRQDNKRRREQLQELAEMEQAEYNSLFIRRAG